MNWPFIIVGGVLPFACWFCYAAGKYAGREGAIWFMLRRSEGLGLSEQKACELAQGMRGEESS